MIDPIHVVHVSPHPDDEAVGCPAALMAFTQFGHTVTNLVTSLGRPEDRKRRTAEARTAARIGGFELVISDDVVAAGPDTYEQVVVSELLALASTDDRPLVLVSPSPHDNHPRHEQVGRAVAEAGRLLGERASWLMYAVWGSLPLPTTYFSFDDDALGRARLLLSAYGGEVARNDYHQLVAGRSMANTTLGMEQIFGFGAAESWPHPFTELFTEVRYLDEAWRAAEPRRLEGSNPTATHFDRDITAWIRQRSPRDLVSW